MKRRDFIKTSSLAGGAVLSASALGQVAAQGAAREFYELRVYEMLTGNRRATLNDYLSKALIPGLNRLGCSPVGAFSVVAGPNNLLQYVLIPYPSLEAFHTAPGKLAADAAYQRDAAPYLSTTIEAPAYTRFESTLLWAFAGVPKIRIPAETAAKKSRLFELRTYESHSEAAAARKIAMFNEGGEIGIFDKVGLRSVFFGQTLIGRRQPNLVYMTVHQDMAARDKTWDDFRVAPEWKALSTDPKYADTVSAITIAFLRPMEYSQI